MSVLTVQEQTAQEQRDVLQRELAALKHVRESNKYKEILYADSIAAAVEAKNNLARQTETEKLADSTHTAKARIDDYLAFQDTVSHRVLFENADGRNAGVQAEEGDVLTAPEVDSPRAETAEMPAPEFVPASEEDARPTRRTMETLHRAESEVAASEKLHIFSVLSTKAKIALVSVICAIVLAIVFICVNTAILNSIRANNDSLRSQLQEQRETHQRLSEQVSEMENYEGSYGERVEEYAKANGMVKE